MVQQVVIQKFARMGSWALAGTHYGTLLILSFLLGRYDETLGPDRSFTTSMPKALIYLFLFIYLYQLFLLNARVLLPLFVWTS